jgi:serine/threonine protein phosphatase PrpC
MLEGGNNPIQRARESQEMFGPQNLNLDQVAKYATMGGFRHLVEHFLAGKGLKKSYMPKAEARQFIEEHFKGKQGLGVEMAALTSKIAHETTPYGYRSANARKRVTTYKRVAKVLSKSSDPGLANVKDTADKLHQMVCLYKYVSQVDQVPSNFLRPEEQTSVAALRPDVARETALDALGPPKPPGAESRDQLLDREMRIETDPQIAEEKLGRNQQVAADQRLEVGMIGNLRDVNRNYIDRIAGLSVEKQALEKNENRSPQDTDRLAYLSNQIRNWEKYIRDNDQEIADIETAVKVESGILVREPQVATEGALLIGAQQYPGQFSTHLGGAVGDAINIGVRSSQEDSHLAVDFEFAGRSVRLTGVFDGHGGTTTQVSTASTFVTQRLQECLTYRLDQFSQQFPDSPDLAIYNALKIALVDVGHLFRWERPEDQTGTTATLQLQIGDHLWVANIGDSRTMLLNTDGSITQLSEDQEPENERFKTAIERRGGKAAYGKVDGVGVTRAIGDPTYQGISSRCKIVRVERPPTGYTLHVCDGVTDVMTTDEIGRFVKARIDAGDSLAAAAAALVEEAFSRGSEDNLSVQIVDLSKTKPVQV